MSLMYMPNQDWGDLEDFYKTLEGIPALRDKAFKKSQEEVDKAYEEKLALFDQLDSLRKENPSSYQSSFDSLAAGGKKDYLWHLYDTGELSKKEYKDQVHTAYAQEFQENAKQGIYTGYVPFEVDGETLFVEARQLDPEVSDTFKSTDWFIKASIKPHDTFYFPEQHAKQPDLTEKDWLVGMADPSGNIQYVDGFKYNPNTQGGYDSTVEGRAENILDPDKGFMGTVAPLINLAGAITGNPLLRAAGTIAAGGDLGDVVENIVGGKVLEVVSAPVLDNFGGTISDLPDSVQNVLLDTTEAVIGGESGTDAFKEAALGEVLNAGEELLSEVDLPDFETPKLIKDLGDAAQDLLEGPVDLIAGAFEPAVNLIDDGLDYIGDSAPVEAIEGVGKEVIKVAEGVGREAIEVAENIGGDVVDFVDENIIDPADDVIEAIGDSDIVEAIEEGGKAVGEVGQDIIDAGSDVLSEAEDVAKEVGRGIDDIVDWESLLKRMVGIGGMGGTGGMMSASRQPTQVEGLFDKELFKFGKEIKSTQEILSPMNRKRRYG